MISRVYDADALTIIEAVNIIAVTNRIKWFDVDMNFLDLQTKFNVTIDGSLESLSRFNASSIRKLKEFCPWLPEPKCNATAK